VVIGYDGKEGNVVLHSGEKAHLTMPIPVFEYLWKKSDYWAMVAVPPDRVPATADETKYVDAIVAMERVAKGDGAARAYAAAVKRWPDDLMARVGLANAYYARGDLAAAERELRAAERAHPDSPVVLNNLAQTLSDLGRQREALALTDRALQSAGAFDAQLRETRALILKRMQGKRQQSAR
jgi:predicted Zn-dependent protease